jgi:uncharacterized protein YxeA
MKKIAVILIALFSTIAFSSPQIGDDKSTKDSALVEQLVSIVTSILQGKDYSEFRENISPEAYVINNNTYESIFEVLDNPSKKEMFVEVTEIKVSFVHLWMPDNQDNAYMVLETKSDDNSKTSWHSILFKISENKKWQILSWHKS